MVRGSQARPLCPFCPAGAEVHELGTVVSGATDDALDHDGQSFVTHGPVAG